MTSGWRLSSVWLVPIEPELWLSIRHDCCGHTHTHSWHTRTLSFSLSHTHTHFLSHTHSLSLMHTLSCKVVGTIKKSKYLTWSNLAACFGCLAWHARLMMLSKLSNFIQIFFLESKFWEQACFLRSYSKQSYLPMMSHLSGALLDSHCSDVECYNCTRKFFSSFFLLPRQCTYFCLASQMALLGFIPTTLCRGRDSNSH